MTSIRQRPGLRAGLLILLTILLAGCTVSSHAANSEEGGAPNGAVVQGPAATATMEPSATLAPTDTPAATATPAPTETPEPTDTPAPTDTPEPTNTPRPTKTPAPTKTPEPTATPTATATPDPYAVVEYEVQPGDTPGEIASTFGVPVDALLAYNGIDDPTRLPAGATLQIPQGEASLAAMYETATAVAMAATATAQAVVATPEPAPVRASIQMGHAYQKPNNCAPTTTSMIVNTFGWNTTQFDLAALQKPLPNDLNVTSEEVAASVREVGLAAYVGIGADIGLIERLVAAGFPVMTEEWMPYDGGVGHFRAIRGYDREQQAIFYNDSYYGPGLWRTYADFARDWRVFNNKFVLIYRPEQEAEVKAIIGANWDANAMFEALRAQSAAEVEANPNDAYALWGLGEALLHLGRPEEAVSAFERSIATGALPWRYMWYRYGFFEALNQTGRYEQLLAVTETTLGQMGRSEDLRYHRAVALHALGRTDEARAQLQLALQENPRYGPAASFLGELTSNQNPGA